MEIFDKAAWHIDAGEDKDDVLAKFNAIFEVLYDREMLTEEGVEVWNMGIDDSVSLHEELVTKDGVEFLKQHYDKLLNYSFEVFAEKLKNL